MSIGTGPRSFNEDYLSFGYMGNDAFISEYSTWYTSRYELISHGSLEPYLPVSKLPVWYPETCAMNVINVFYVQLSKLGL